MILIFHAFCTHIHAESLLEFQEFVHDFTFGPDDSPVVDVVEGFFETHLEFAHQLLDHHACTARVPVDAIHQHTLASLVTVDFVDYQLRIAIT